MGKKTSTSFQPGAKPGPGRPKGSSTKAKISKAEETMAALGFNPVEFLIDLATNRKTRPDIRAKIGIELSSLINPKAREADGPNDPDEDDDFGDVDLKDEGKLLSIFKQHKESHET